jgi:hypothetical protein
MTIKINENSNRLAKEWLIKKDIKHHGGKRPNAGRKRKEPTTTIRVPLILKDEIKKFISMKGF